MKFKLGIILNPDSAKQILGWDKEEPIITNGLGTYYSKSNDDITFFYDDNASPVPRVFYYDRDQTITVVEEEE